MSGKFVLKRGTSGKYRFNLLASNGKVIATSEPYESKSAALHGIESGRRNASGRELEISLRPVCVRRCLRLHAFLYAR